MRLTVTWAVTVPQTPNARLVASSVYDRLFEAFTVAHWSPVPSGAPFAFRQEPKGTACPVLSSRRTSSTCAQGGKGKLVPLWSRRLTCQRSVTFLQPSALIVAADIPLKDAVKNSIT